MPPSPAKSLLKEANLQSKRRFASLSQLPVKKRGVVTAQRTGGGSMAEVVGVRHKDCLGDYDPLVSGGGALKRKKRRQIKKGGEYGRLGGEGEEQKRVSD